MKHNIENIVSIFKKLGFKNIEFNIINNQNIESYKLLDCPVKKSKKFNFSKFKFEKSCKIKEQGKFFKKNLLIKKEIINNDGSKDIILQGK